MDFQFAGSNAGKAVTVTLDAGEVFTAEVGAMIAMDTSITVETTSRQAGKSGGGILKGLRRMFSGENFFLNHFTSHQNGSKLILGPKLVGEVDMHTLEGQSLIIQGSSWLGSGAGVEIDTTWAGFGNALLSGEGIFWVRCSGIGPVLFNAFGAMYSIQVDGEYVVDSGHIVAFEDTLQFEPTKAADSWASSIFGGEGLASRFKGHGRLICQTHNPRNLGTALGPKLKPRSN